MNLEVQRLEPLIEPLMIEPPPRSFQAPRVGQTISMPNYPVSAADPASEIASRARSFFAKGDFEAAAGEYERLAEMRPGTLSYCLLGGASYSAGDLKGSAAAYRKAIKAAQKARRAGHPVPREIEAIAHCGLGIDLILLGTLDEALTEFRTLVKANPQDTLAYYLLGDVHALRGHRQLAIDAYEKVLELNSNLTEPFLYIAKLYTELGKSSQTRQDQFFSKAIETYRRLLEVWPDSAAAQNNIGVLLFWLGDTGAAITAYERVLELDPTDPEARTNLGAAYLDARRFSEAKEAFETAIKQTKHRGANEVRGRDLAWRQHLGLAAALDHLYEQQAIGRKDSALLVAAESALVQLTALDSLNALSHHLLGVVRAELGDLENAQRDLLRAVQLDPENQEVQAALQKVMAARYAPGQPGDEAEERRVRETLQVLNTLLEGDEEEQTETFARLKQALEEDRLSERRLFSD